MCLKRSCTPSRLVLGDCLRTPRLSGVFADDQRSERVGLDAFDHPEPVVMSDEVSDLWKPTLAAKVCGCAEPERDPLLQFIHPNRGMPDRCTAKRVCRFASAAQGYFLDPGWPPRPGFRGRAAGVGLARHGGLPPVLAFMPPER